MSMGQRASTSGILVAIMVTPPDLGCTSVPDSFNMTSFFLWRLLSIIVSQCIVAFTFVMAGRGVRNIMLPKNSLLKSVDGSPGLKVGTCGGSSLDDLGSRLGTRGPGLGNSGSEDWASGFVTLIGNARQSSCCCWETCHCIVAFLPSTGSTRKDTNPGCASVQKTSGKAKWT